MAFKHVFVSVLLPERCKLGIININNLKHCDHICLMQRCSSSKAVANFTSMAEREDLRARQGY